MSTKPKIFSSWSLTKKTCAGLLYEMKVIVSTDSYLCIWEDPNSLLMQTMKKRKGRRRKEERSSHAISVLLLIAALECELAVEISDLASRRYWGNLHRGKNINKASLLNVHNRMANVLPNLWYYEHRSLVNQQQRPSSPVTLTRFLNLKLLCNRTQLYSSKSQHGQGRCCPSGLTSGSPLEKQGGQVYWATAGSSIHREGPTPGCCWGCQGDQWHGRGNRHMKWVSLVTSISITKCRPWLDFRWKQIRSGSNRSEEQAGHKASGVWTGRNVRIQTCFEHVRP